MIDKKDIKIGLRFLMKIDGEPCKHPDGWTYEFTVTGFNYQDGVVYVEADGRINFVLTAFLGEDEHNEAFYADEELEKREAKPSQTPVAAEQVNHPSHYSWLKDLCGVEPIEICRCFDFSIGNALKYLMRKGKVDGDKTEKEKRIEDLRKAVFYIEDEIRRLEDGSKE